MQTVEPYKTAPEETLEEFVQRCRIQYRCITGTMPRYVAAVSALADQRDEALLERDAMGADRDRLRADLARVTAEREAANKDAARCPRTHAAADAFWRVWRENGKTHEHGYYESTWMAVDAAMRDTGSAGG